MGVYYCKKCGRILDTYRDNIEHRCECCNSLMDSIPDKYLSDGMFITKEEELKLIEELVKTSVEFDQYLFDHRDDILMKHNLEFNQKMAIGNAISKGVKPKEAFKGNFNVAKCPSCGSTNISKIGTVSRMISTGIFGLASSKIGKTHKCNNCGTTW